MKYKRYTSIELKEAIKNSKSWKQVCEYLNSGIECGSQSNFKKRADRENITYKHFIGSGWNKGISSKKYISALEYLKCNYIKSHILKLKLIKEHILKKECNLCKIKEWNNEEVVWELDHIDGNHYNNKLDNLQILCPNCHSQKTRMQRKK